MTAIRPLRRSTVIALAACVGLVGIPIASASAGADGRAAIARALDYERARDYRAARVEALNAVRASRGAAAAHLVRARVAIALKDGDDAAEAAAAAASAGASADEVRPLAAHAALLRGEPGRALEILAEGPVRADDAAYGARLRGMAALAAGDLASAAGAFDEAVAIAPRDPATWIEIARFRLANADLIGATDAVDLAIEIDPRNAAALRLRANITRDRNGLIASLAWYERAVAIDPSDVDTLADYAATLGDAGRYRAMLAIARRAHALAPRDPRPMFLRRCSRRGRASIRSPARCSNASRPSSATSRRTCSCARSSKMPRAHPISRSAGPSGWSSASPTTRPRASSWPMPA